MIIYWRVCEQQETQSFVPRWENKDKRELLRKCWMSIQASIEESDIIFILWDKVRKETIDWLVSTSKTSKIQILECPIYELDPAIEAQLGEVMDKRRHHYSALTEIMDANTKLFPNEIHYLCNDDFLHLPYALQAMKSVYKGGWTGYVVAYDYPDRYTMDRTRSCDLLLNEYSHWRTIPCCTGCTSALGSTWQTYMKLFKQNAIYNSDSFTWEIYAKAGCLSPIPGMATHLTQNCISPRVDWKTFYDSIDIGENSWQ